MALPIGAIIGGATTAASMLGIGEGRQDKRQIRQQGAINDVNAKTAKEMADYEQNLKLKMWKDTNYGAQLAEAEKAGVSKAAAIGGSGTGTQGASVGNVGGGSAADAAATSNSKAVMMQQGLQFASQLALQKAQKENIEADTENKKASTGQTTIATDTATKGQEDQLKEIKAKAETAVEEMWLKSNERTVSDHTIKQRVQKVAEELIGQILNNKNTTADTKKKEAEAVIAGFEAKMSEEGISTKAPWWLKMVADQMEKVGVKILK